MIDAKKVGDFMILKQTLQLIPGVYINMHLVVICWLLSFRKQDMVANPVNISTNDD